MSHCLRFAFAAPATPVKIRKSISFFLYKIGINLVVALEALTLPHPLKQTER